MIKKAIAVGIVGLFVIGGLVGMLLIMPGEVEAPGPTYVSGIISSDTTWYFADSPYIVTGNVLIPEGVNLTIEPGVEVRFNDGLYLQIGGTLIAEGTENHKINFTSNKTSPALGDWEGIKFTNPSNGSNIKYCEIRYGEYGIYCNGASPTIIEYSKLEYTQYGIYLDGVPTTISNNEFFNNNECVYASYSNSLMVNNTVSNCERAARFEFSTPRFFNNNITETRFGIGLHICNSTLINGNTISNGEHGINYYNSSSVEIKRNTIVNCSNYGIQDSESSAHITYNTIETNGYGIKVTGGATPFIDYNNLIQNVNYNVWLHYSCIEDVYAPYNWWGTTNTDLINQSIYDYYDDLSLGEVIYLPFLTSPIIEDGSGLQEGAPWPMFRGNVRHTGLSPYDTSGNPGELKWSFETGHVIVSSPAISSDGIIYFGSDDYHFYAVYPNGTEKWSINIGWNIESSPAIGKDGTIYFGAHNRRFYAINPDGSEKWNFITDEVVHNSPTIRSDGVIYIGSDNNPLYAINPNGTELWNFTSIRSTGSSPALGADGTLYIASYDSNLYAIYPNGTEKWDFYLGSSSTSSPAIGPDGIIYIGSGDENVYAIDSDGNKIWDFTTLGNIRSSPAIGSDGTIYIGSDDHILYAIYPNGSEKWKFITGGWVASSPAIGLDGTIYFGSNDGGIYAVNPDGSEKWNYSSVSTTGSSPAIGSDGTIYVGSDHILMALGDVPNQPPNIPTIPSGTILGETNTSYSFSTSTTDPDGDQIKYGWDWNEDGIVDEWSSLVDSGTEDNRSHSWPIVGVYNVKIKAQDEYGEESDWSDVLSITIIEPPIPESPEIIGTIPDIELGEDFPLYQIDLSSFAYDPQDPLSNLKWYITGMDTSITSIEGENQTGNHNLSLESQDNMSGNMEVTYWLVDTEGNTASQNAWINVTPVNDPPIFSKCPVIAIYVNSPYTLNLTSYIIDIDSSISELFLTSSDPAHTSINGLEVTFIYPDSMAGQTVYVNLSVSDGVGSVNDTIEIILVEELDTDDDGIPDSIDEDDDNDGYNDDIDLFPLDLTEWMDSDYDGIGDNADMDDDNDGFTDENDQFPFDHTEWLDTDGDGIGNNADLDDDNDGHIDEEDYYPLDPTRWAAPESDIIISSITLSKYGPNVGEEVTIYIEIENTGNDDCDIIVRFYDGNPDDGVQIGSDHEITISSDNSISVTQSWIATSGNHTLYVIVEDLSTGEEVTAYLPITVGENIQPVLVLTTGDINIYRFEPSQERTISVEVTCYRQTVNHVRLVVLDDQNLTIDNSITPSITMTDGQTTKFYLRIKAPQLPEGVDKLEKDILIQAVGDNGIFSNAEELDIVVSESAVTFLDPIIIAGAVATGSLATLGAAAAASRRNENWKYLLLLTFAVPLYTRIHGKKTLDNFVRGQVYGHIQSKPGTHFNDIKKTLKVGNGNLAYHLRKLEKEGFIKSSRDKRYRRFYPVGVEVVEDDGIKLSKTQESILDYIEQHPKSNQKEIAKELKESQQTISYNLNVLVREGFLTEEKFKGTKRYEIIEENT